MSVSRTGPVRTAVLGAGHGGPNLIRNFHSPPASVVGIVVDRDGKRLEQVRGRFPGVAVSQDPAAAFADASVEAVVIATPTSTHFALAKAALGANSASAGRDWSSAGSRARGEAADGD